MPDRQGCKRFIRKGVRTGEQFVQDHAQAVNVSERGDGFAANLFRRDVGWRTGHDIGLGQFDGALHVFGNAKIGEIGVALLIEQDVGRLDVAMHHALPMGGGKRGRDLIDQAYSGLNFPGASLQGGTQTSAAQPAHHQVSAIGLPPVVIEGHDVRMFQPGHQLGLGLETANEFGVVGILGQDGLDGHLTPHLGLACAKNDAKPTLADALEELVASDTPFSPSRHASKGLASTDLFVQVGSLR